MDLQQARDLIAELESQYRVDPEAAHASLRAHTEAILAQEEPELALLLLDELAWQATTRFDAEEALPWIQRLLELAEQSGQHQWIGCANNTYGVFFLNAGEPLAAIDRMIPALEAFEAAGNLARAASVLANIGEMLVEMGEVERAGPYLEEAEQLGADTLAAASGAEGDLAVRPELHINMVYVLVDQRYFSQAWKRVVRIWREDRAQPGWALRGRAHELAGWIRYQQGEPVPAIRHLNRAIALYQEDRDAYRTASSRLLLGDIHQGQEALALAAEAYGQTAEISGALGYRKLEIEALRKLLPVTAGPLEGLAAQQRLVVALRQADERNKRIRKNFVDIRIRSEAVLQERLRLERDLERDALTGLRSHRRFAEQLERVAENCDHFALLFLDVDKLKELNDRLGHAAGDMLLRSFANDLADALPKGGLAFRKSGDEFLVVLPNARRSDVTQYLQDLFARLGVRRRIGETRMMLSGSAGIAMYPDDATLIEQLEWMADQAMYQAKADGRNRWAWHAKMEKR